MKLKNGPFRVIARKNPDYHSFNVGDVVMIIEKIESSIPGGKKRPNGYIVLNINTNVTQQVVTEDLSEKFSRESLDILKKYFKKELEKIDKLEEAINDLQKEDITEEEFCLWVIDTVHSKEGSTKKQRIESIKEYFESAF